jgi:hypothetical protein
MAVNPAVERLRQLRRLESSHKSKSYGTVQELMEELTAAGFVIEAEGENLWVRPKQNLTPNQRERVRHHKDAVLAFLSGKEPLPALPPPPAEEAPLQSETLTLKDGSAVTIYFRTQAERKEAIADARLNLWPKT